MVSPYRPEAVTNFEDDATARSAMESALGRVRRALGRRYPLIIGGRPVTTGETFLSVNPSNPEEVIGIVAKADRAAVDAALDAAWQAYPAWSRVPGPDRAEYLYKLAAVMRRRRFELAAWEILEAGKPWSEADGDVAEAISFCEYYGRQMERLAEPVPVVALAGENDAAFYMPLGVGVILPPWNFPLAILTGMTTAPVVAGNTVLLKPASPTPVVAAIFMELVAEAGFPPGVVNWVPGDGDVIGDYLVTHPRTRFVSFTGSQAVGLRVNRLAAETPPGQRWIKRVVAELGGKDAIIVDETADLDAAARDITLSAFGFQGQKCSACSRAIVVETVYERLVGAVVERASRIRVGSPEDPTVSMGPVINERAVDKIMSYIDDGQQYATLLWGGRRLDRSGYFIEPTIFGDVPPESKIAQEEIFGPVLSCIRVRDFDEALAVANDTDYGLTGSVYTRRRDRIARAKVDFEVGNLYINRPCTGAIVGVHPFGGLKLSGTDAKTGGPDYLLQFLQMKAVGERL
jgi:1-pyrroline-5-carboxylate dehydrogenase